MDQTFAEHLAQYGPQAPRRKISLAEARRYCAQLTHSHYENFTVASRFLPRKLVPHFYPIYAYCRWADDLGDETGGGEKAIALLDWWKHELQACFQGEAWHPVMVALIPTIQRFQIPIQPFLDLLLAFVQDQRVTRYTTFEELQSYCRYSANPVGHLVLYLGESFTEETGHLSDFVCTGLQLANFWQDVERDYRELNRIYLPEEDRRRFGVTEQTIAQKRFDTSFAELLRFEVQRTHKFFEEGKALLDLLPMNLRIDIDLFIRGGQAILHKIEAQGYDVLTARPRLSKKEKIGLIFQALRDHSKHWLQRRVWNW